MSDEEMSDYTLIHATNDILNEDKTTVALGQLDIMHEVTD